jgi:hypothetical protein
MRIVIVITLALAIVGLQAGHTSADEKCHYVFKTGQGLVDSCTGEKASNSNPRGGGPPILACHPSYVGVCLKPDAEDYDCDFGPQTTGNGPYYVKGPVRIVGEDVFRLDSLDPTKINGIGCEADD